jgi:hypothetical protein
MNRFLLALLLAAQAFTAGAQEAIPHHPALTDKFYLGAGAFFPKTTTSAQLTTRTGVGANIDFEESLGLKTADTVPAGFARWRFGERWRVEAEYFQLNRSGEKAIDRTIQWGENTYPVNASVQSKFDFSDLRISVGYSFFKTRDKEFGVGIGLHVAAYDVGLSANMVGSEQQDVTAPLPVLSLYGQVALTDHWAISGRLDRLSLSYKNYDGSLTAMGLDLMYQPFRHVGFGLGYRNLFINLDAEDDGRTLKLKQTFQGPLLFMNVSF